MQIKYFAPWQNNDGKVLRRQVLLMLVISVMGQGCNALSTPLMSSTTRTTTTQTVSPPNTTPLTTPVLPELVISYPPADYLSNPHQTMELPFQTPTGVTPIMTTELETVTNNWSGASSMVTPNTPSATDTDPLKRTMLLNEVIPKSMKSMWVKPTAQPNSSTSAPLPTVGMVVNTTRLNASNGVLAMCPPVTVPLAQPEWYMPGFQRIESRRCDGQFVTCGNGYPCSTPTPKEPEVSVLDGYGYGQLPSASATEIEATIPSWEGGYDYYTPPTP